MGVMEAGGADSTGVVPGAGGTTVAGGVDPHSVTVTVVVTVFAPSDEFKYQQRSGEVHVR